MAEVAAGLGVEQLPTALGRVADGVGVSGDEMIEGRIEGSERPFVRRNGAQHRRRIQMDELQKLATAYRTSANAILRREAVHLDMVPRFRKLSETGDDALEQATHLL